MGKSWDASGIAYDVSMWRECFRVLKPGGHLLAFGGSRTYHRLASAVEDAGFEIRDQIMWLYGQGFPKSLNVSKAMDKAAGAERAVIGTDKNFGSSKAEDGKLAFGDYAGQWDITAPSSAEAKKWDGWGTALKPAHEPIVVARKPLVGTVVQNVLVYGTGAINIDKCRVGTEEIPSNKLEEWSGFGQKVRPAYTQTTHEGRWPANVIHDGSADVVDEFDKYGDRAAGRFPSKSKGDGPGSDIYGKYTSCDQQERNLDHGTVARFFKEVRPDDAVTNFQMQHGQPPGPEGRWPANVIHDGSDEVLDEFAKSGEKAGKIGANGYWGMAADKGWNQNSIPYKSEGYQQQQDFGTPARFFYCAKASKRDRNEGCDGLNDKLLGYSNAAKADIARGREPYVNTSGTNSIHVVKNNHPTVKPTELMRYLVRLVTPPGGTVLDPFMGSGSTGKAALLEGFQFIGIDMNQEYIEIATARIGFAVGAAA